MADIVPSRGSFRFAALCALALVAAAASPAALHVAVQGDAGLPRPGRSLHRSLTAGEAHTYQVPMRAGQYLDVLIEQRGIDIAARVFDAANVLVREFDTPTGALGQERVRIVVDATSDYRLEIRALQPEAEAGAYELRLVAKRAASGPDKRVDAAVMALADADRLRASAATRAESVQRYRQARALWQLAGNRAGEASALRALGFAYVRLKDDAAAEEVFTEAQRIFRALKDRRSDAYIHLILANVHSRRGNLRMALVTTARALPLWRAAKDPEQEAFTLAALGTLRARLGDAIGSERFHHQALGVARATGRAGLQAAMLQSAGSATDPIRDPGTALAHYAGALALWEKAGHRRGQANAHFAIAALEEAGGNTGSAARHFERAAELWREAGVPDQEANARSRLDALKKKGRPEELSFHPPLRASSLG